MRGEDFAKFDVTCRQALAVRCDMRARQMRFGVRLLQTPHALNLTLIADLFLNLNFVLVDLLLNFIIAGAAD